MKKIKNILLVICLMFLLTGCGKINNIEYKDLVKKFENKDTFILYIGSSECSNCKMFSPKFKKIVNEYNIKNVYEIDLSKLTETESNKFNSIINVAGTPNVAFIVKGEEENTFNRIDGNVSTETIIERLKANNIIK